MKAVRLTYRYKESNTSRLISMYFRLIGIYVTERYLDVDLDLEDELKAFREDCLDVSVSKDTFDYDAEIFLLSEIEDLNIYHGFEKEHKCVFVFCDKLEKERDISEDIIYERSDDVLGKIISLLCKKQIIDETEEEDFKLTSNVYMKKNYLKTTMGGKYFFVLDNWSEKKRSEYDAIAHELIGELGDEDVSEWGENRYRRTQYAVANLVYEADVYCRRNYKDYLFNIKSLLRMIEQIDRKQSKYLGNTAKCLLGQVYNDLFGDANTAYEYFLQGCDKSESLYNAYIFKIKGMYWQYFVGDYQRAIKYFYKSVCIHKEYFAAWYKMGFCYYKMDKKRKAFIAFNAVVKILKPKFMQTCLTPKETEHLFLASKQCAGIIYELDADIERAIEYDLLAESVWKNIGDNGFYMFLSDDYEEQNNLRKETQRRLNIKMVYDHISKMYKMDNEYQIARKYEEKYLSI